MKKMSKERYEGIIDGAYKLYSNEYEKDNSIGLCLLVQRVDGRATYRKPDREMFIALCTHDTSFSEKWGLKIEERELSLEERTKLLVNKSDNKKDFYDRNGRLIVEDESILNDSDIPSKLITLTYKNETIEVYE